MEAESRKSFLWETFPQARQRHHACQPDGAAMVCEYGMSEALGPIKFTPDDKGSYFGELAKDYSDKTAELIDDEVKKLVSNAYEDAKVILMGKRPELEALKEALVKYETVDGEDVKRILAGQTISKPTVSDILASEQQRRAEIRREEEKRNPGTEGGPLGPIPQPG